MTERIPGRARKGRGAVSNARSTRFTALQSERTGDDRVRAHAAAAPGADECGRC